MVARQQRRRRVTVPALPDDPNVRPDPAIHPKGDVLPVDASPPIEPAAFADLSSSDGGSGPASPRADREVRVFIGLGSNVGDRLNQLAAAVRFLDGPSGFRLERVSSVYETAPVGPVEQPSFLNAVAIVHTSLAPEALLTALKAFEQRAGREDVVRWGPRAIDLDILLYGRLELTSSRLQIPHPELTRRAFVLVPLAELDPHLRIPGLETSASSLRDRAPGLESVVRVGNMPRL